MVREYNDAKDKDNINCSDFHVMVKSIFCKVIQLNVTFLKDREHILLSMSIEHKNMVPLDSARAFIIKLGTDCSKAIKNISYTQELYVSQSAPHWQKAVHWSDTFMQTCFRTATPQKLKLWLTYWGKGRPQLSPVGWVNPTPICWRWPVWSHLQRLSSTVSSLVHSYLDVLYKNIPSGRDLFHSSFSSEELKQSLIGVLAAGAIILKNGQPFQIRNVLICKWEKSLCDHGIGHPVVPSCPLPPKRGHWQYLKE